MRLSLLLATVSIAIPLVASSAETHTVALTIDDLPFVTADSSRSMLPVDAKAAAAANHKLLNVLARHHVPVTGFVIQKGVEDLGLVSGTQILREWTERGFDLGNHSYEHPNFNDLTVQQFEDQIIRGEATFVPLMKAAHRKPEFFRFPYNHTGDTKEKHDAVAAFLAQRGYRLAPCTIETEDWMFNEKYFLMRSRHDEAAAARLRADYLAFTAAQIDYFTALDKQVWGYEAPQIMLIHDNQLNADVIEDLLALFEKRQYRFVTLSQAESDSAYQLPETFITSYGPMWGYRWAKERGVKVDGSLEPDPPKWITEYGKEPAKP
jgi:peptidoglycan/xylan/chitin deacetylase (PgdA/CDA1 family)